jgi:APA family basic amino acid/polyamine antiporter
MTSAPAASASSSSHPIGFWTSVALVMGNMIGSGVFLLPASLAPYGGLGLVGWVLSAAGAVVLALVFARLAGYNPTSGGPYAYTRQAYGDLAGFLVAWGYLISIWSTNAALAVAFVGYLDPFFPSIVRTPALAAALAITIVWVFTAVNLAGLRVAGQMQILTTALKVLPLIAIAIAGFVFFDASRFAIPPEQTGNLAKGLMATTTLTLFAFLGIECATIPSGDTANATSTVPRATIVGTLLTTVIYVCSTVGVMSLLDPGVLKQSAAPFADAARSIGGHTAAAAVALGAAISCLGALNGWILISGQIPMAMASDRLLPIACARLSSRGVPAFSMVIGSLLASLLIVTNYSESLVDLFTFVILLATLSTLVPYVFCALAGFILHRRDPRFQWSAGAAVISSLAFGYSLFAIAGAGMDVVYYGFLLLMAGLPIYALIAPAK